MSQIKLEIGSTPTTPPAGYITVYPKSDKKIYIKDEDGVETDLTSGGGTVVNSFEGRTGAVVATSGDYSANQITNVPHGTITHTQVQAAINHLEDNKAPITHVGSKGVSNHAVADGTDAGFMSPSDKTKLDGIASGATANDTDANLKNRANHTGTQLAGTISDFSTAADARVAIGIADHVAEADPHPNYALSTELAAGITTAENRSNHTGTQLAATISDFDAAAKAATVDNAIVNGVTTRAPSQDAVFDALNDKVDKAGDSMDGPLEIVGDLLGTGHVILRPQDNDPSVPTSGVALFADTTENLSWMSQSGFKSKLDSTAQTADRSYTLPDADGLLMMDPMVTDGDIIYRDGGIPAPLPIGSEDQILQVKSGLPSWQDVLIKAFFGGGTQGSATFSGSITLSQDAYYDTLTILPGASINTNGYSLAAKTLDISSAGIAGAFNGNGNAGGNATTNVGAAGGGALAAQHLGNSGAGGTGATGTTGVGVLGSAGNNSTPANGGNGGSSGNSGTGTNGGIAGGAGGTVSLPVKFDRLVLDMLRGAAIINGGAGGRGGNSGGGDGTNVARGGGGGGGGARVGKFYFGTIITSASTPDAVFSYVGGAGGRQLNAPLAGNVGGAGGGGGGGGGAVYLAYGRRVGPAVPSLISCAGGRGGDGSVGLGAHVAGSGGQGGSGGIIYVFNVTTGVGVEVIGATGTAGSAAVGATPGVGGNGGLCNAGV